MPAEPACPPAPLRLALDTAALAGNWRALNDLSGDARAGAAVKADGYGTGARRAVRTLSAAGCADFFVAHWGEAAAIADLVPPASIAVLHGPLTTDEAAWAVARGVRPVLNSLEQVRRWREASGGPCHVMVDTGMNRLGLPLGALGDRLLAGLEIDILLSHLVAAEEDSPLNARQLERWQEARRLLPHRRASLANSAGITLGPDYHGDLTRPGLSLYGGVPCAALAPHIRQVVWPEAAILQVRTVAAGETVGYNATFTAPRTMRIGIIALGYADGYLRAWSGRGSASLDGQRLAVLGRVSMDMTALDLDAVPQAGEGDWVAVDYHLPAAAALTGLSQYELLTSLGARLLRS